MHAFKMALTKRLAVIQGPPGTGKTYVGWKIARVLLQTPSLWEDAKERTPILMVSYTNHALDQFLEGVLSTTKSEMCLILLLLLLLLLLKPAAINIISTFPEKRIQDLLQVINIMSCNVELRRVLFQELCDPLNSFSLLFPTTESLVSAMTLHRVKILNYCKRIIVLSSYVANTYNKAE